MQVNTRRQAVATYNGVKDAIMAAAPGNDAISQEGGAYSVKDNVSINFGGESYTVAKNSHFDDTLDTPDKVVLKRDVPEGAGMLERRAATTTFEHSGRKKLFFFQGEKLTVSGVTRNSIPGGFVGGSFSHEYNY